MSHARGIALVIGNAGYQNVQSLANSVRDAQLMAKTLTRLGFELAGDAVFTDLDACRNNPFPSGRSLGGTDRGLAPMTATEGTVIAYAAESGKTAEDGEPGGNGPYATALATSLVTPGLDVLPLFNRAAVLVSDKTNGFQQPWMSSSPIRGSFYFAGR
jgi:uncharacterized caspase-like protein